MAAFVLGTAAFLALTSFVLVTLLKGVLSPDKPSSTGDDSGEESPALSTGKAESGKPPLRPSRKRRSPAAEPPKPAEDDE